MGMRAGQAMRHLGVVSLLFGVVAGTLADAPPAEAGPPTCYGLPATIDDHTGKIVGTSGADVIVGDDGANSINGKGGNDTICGFGGNDTIKGGAGNDDLFGEGGTDTLDGGARSDFCAQDGQILTACDRTLAPAVDHPKLPLAMTPDEARKQNDATRSKDKPQKQGGKNRKR